LSKKPVVEIIVAETMMVPTIAPKNAPKNALITLPDL
jgi:hypothetical protein